MLVSLTIVTTACGSESPMAAQAATTTSSAPTVTTTVTMTPPPPAAAVAAATLLGEAAIADNFDVNNWLAPSPPADTSPDPVGAFRFTCLPGHLSKNDPIVYPGQKGASHLHQFFGNTDTDESSTYASLRTKGGSTCTRSTGESPQRSAYWAPAMLDGVGNAVKPDIISTYYKAIPNTNPACGLPDATHLGYCTALPNGLRFIFGYNMRDGSGGPTDINSADQWTMGFDCVARTDMGLSRTGNKHSIAEIVASGKCEVGDYLRAYLIVPDCWDGKNLDSPDHRSHMSYAGGALIEGKRACMPSHPYMIPEIMVQLFYTVDENFVSGKWRLASDDAMGVPPAQYGKTWHADYWEAWSPTIKALWESGCINRHLTCSIGQLGNGMLIKGMQNDGVLPTQAKVPLSSIN